MVPPLSAVVAGNNLTLNANITFQPIFVGAKNIWLDGIDTANHLDSGFQLLGTWNLPVPTPAPVSVTPNAGIGDLRDLPSGSF